MTIIPDFLLDCSDQLCPIPILMTEEKMQDLNKGDILEVLFTDPGAKPDLMAWCRMEQHEFLEYRRDKKAERVYIRKRGNS